MAIMHARSVLGKADQGLKVIGTQAIAVAVSIVNRAEPALHHKLGEPNAVVSENLSGIREIKIFVHEETELVRIGDRT